jgi:LPXTG-site transpeptidase (sortase) family protein
MPARAFVNTVAGAVAERARRLPPVRQIPPTFEETMDSDRQPLQEDPTGSTGPADMSGPPQRGRHARPRIFTARSILFVILCGFLAYAVVAFLTPAGGPVTAPETVTRPAATAPPSLAAPTPAPTPTPAASPAPAAPAAPAGPAASPPQRLVYAAANIDVVIHPLEPSGQDQANQTIVPPPTMDGYWLTPYGVPGEGSANTTYVAGHSWVDRDAPFNHLSAKAAVGDQFTVTTATGELAYRVDSVATYSKSGLKDSPIWQVQPNRMVLISCYTEDPWGTNVVVVASPDPNVPPR